MVILTLRPVILESQEVHDCYGTLVFKQRVVVQLSKEEKFDRLNSVLYNLVETIRIIAITLIYQKINKYQLV